MDFDRPIAIALILFTIVLLIFFLVVPKYNQFKVLQQTLGEKQAAYDAKFAYYSEIGTIYAKLVEKKEIVEKIDNAIPSEMSYGPLVYFFQKKALENGLIVKGLFLTKAAPINPDSELREIVFSMNLLGEYTALKSFMASLERSARLFDTNNISFGTMVAPVTPASSSSSKTPAKSPVQIQIIQTYPFQLEIKTYSY